MNEHIGRDRQLERGWFYFNRQQYSEAVDQARHVLKEDPQDENAHLLMGWCALLCDDTAAAMESAKAVLAANPHAADGHELVGHIEHLRKSTLKAEDAFRTAVRLEPEDAGFRASLGLFLGQRGRVEEGITVAHKGLKIAPEDTRVLHALQTLYRLNDEPELAERMAEQALRIDPEHSGHHLEVGLQILERRQARGARASFLESLRLNPADGEAKDVIAHERVRTHPFFKNGIYLPFSRRLFLPTLCVPLVWYGLALVFRPFIYLCWASIFVLIFGYFYHGLFVFCRWKVRRGLERGRL